MTKKTEKSSAREEALAELGFQGQPPAPVKRDTSLDGAYDVTRGEHEALKEQLAAATAKADALVHTVTEMHEQMKNMVKLDGVIGRRIEQFERAFERRRAANVEGEQRHG